MLKESTMKSEMPDVCACGCERTIPRLLGRGRQRRYFNATCRKRKQERGERELRHRVEELGQTTEFREIRPSPDAGLRASKQRAEANADPPQIPHEIESLAKRAFGAVRDGYSRKGLDRLCDDKERIDAAVGFLQREAFIYGGDGWGVVQEYRKRKYDTIPVGPRYEVHAA